MDVVGTGGGGAGRTTNPHFALSQVAKNADGKVRSSTRLAGSTISTFNAQKKQLSRMTQV